MKIFSNFGKTKMKGSKMKKQIISLSFVLMLPSLAKAEAIIIKKIEFAQTHVLPASGLSWNLPNASGSFNLTSGREALVLVTLAQSNVQQAQIEVRKNDKLLGSMTLIPPSSLPGTESKGRRYGTDIWSARIPPEWMTSGASFSVSAPNYTASASQTPIFASTDAQLFLRILPFYLYGADDSNSSPLDKTKKPDLMTTNEIYSELPVSRLIAENHPIGKISLSSIVVGPRADESGIPQSAYVADSFEKQKDSYAIMDSVLSYAKDIRTANGDDATNNQYYSPIIAINPITKTPVEIGGGLATDGASVGDENFSGVFIHELVHGFGISHAGSDYAAGKYPYMDGSLTGSVWGYDRTRKQFLDIRIPETAVDRPTCRSTHQTDSEGFCIKQDPMQGGDGDQSSGYKFTMLSDYTAGEVQKWFKNKIIIDQGSRTGYSKWDTNTETRLPYSPETDNNGLYGINNNLPIRTNVPVYSISITFSLPGTPNVSQIYPPLRYTGNLIRTFDPTNASDLAAVTPDIGEYPWYCIASGCDYSVRVTYSDNSQIIRLLQGGFRPWVKPTDPPSGPSIDPTNTSSFKLWTVNVPGEVAISKVELISTPMVWKGLPNKPIVLLSR
ncbi:M66 family metalloprotease [Caballeronia sp. LZ035]|uniref:M66 family metalloprotease n=1 Tax=Caballeronia sp. LZ035 TaxID=3038568 RepID=UPI00285FB2C0|nr:M66 family metalloprotease [Caballeronia sp. LZ035]MDR5755993.1 M66 family metalloprotease [Caballeronia sp. LZ035]